MIIDTHCHLGLEDYDDIEQVIKNFEGNIMIISGVDNKTNKEVVNIVTTPPIPSLHPFSINLLAISKLSEKQ